MKDSDNFLPFSEFKDQYGIIQKHYLDLAFYELLSVLKQKIKVPLRNNTNMQYESFIRNL